jgi:hypothetical protein
MAMALTMVAGSSAWAGAYTDDLGKCLVRSSSEADRTVLMQWMFSALSANPAVSSLASISEAQREAFNKAAADLLERLVLRDCRQTATEAVKYEGPKALEASFSVLGEVAARGLMADPKAAAELQKLGGHLDHEAWAAFGKEAGMPGPATPAK